MNDFAEMFSCGTPELADIRGLKPQHVFLEGAHDPFVGRFEDMAEEVSRLDALLGARLDLPHLNREPRLRTD